MIDEAPEALKVRGGDNLVYMGVNQKMIPLDFEEKQQIIGKIKRSFADYVGKDDNDGDMRGDNYNNDMISEGNDNLRMHEKEEVYREIESFLPRSIRQWGGKDRHSKVLTSRGVLRDRRVRLSVSTAIRFYDVQDRLGFDQPSKAVEWLLDKAQWALQNLPFPHISPTPSPFITPTFTSEFCRPNKNKLPNAFNFSNQYPNVDSSPAPRNLSPLTSSFANNIHHNDLCEDSNFEANYSLNGHNYSDAADMKANNNILANNDLSLCDMSSFVGVADGKYGEEAHNVSIVGSNFVNNTINKEEKNALENESGNLLYGAARQGACSGSIDNSMDMEKEGKNGTLKRSAGSMEEGENMKMAHDIYKSIAAAAASAIDLQSPIIMINQAAYLCSTPPFMQASYLINIAGDHVNNIDTSLQPQLLHDHHR